MHKVGHGEGLSAPMPLQAVFSLPLHVCTNWELSELSTFGVLWGLHYKAQLIKSLAIGN